MSSHELKVTSRNSIGKEAAKKLRHSGQVPAVAYGHQEEPIKLAVDAKELRDLLAHGGTHGLLTLKYSDSSAADVPVIIKELQRHPAKHSVTSISFLRVALDQKITDKVPVVLEGEPVGVKIDGGVLVQALHEIEVSALPQDLPEHITVDVSNLELNGAPLHVKEISLPAGITAITDGEEPVAVVNPPAVEPETTETAEAAEVPSEHGSSDDDNAGVVTEPAGE